MDDENLPQTEDLTHEFLRVDDLRKRKPATIGLVLQRSALNESDITAITVIVFRV